jgi:predicted PurR-regulated permease PerM
LNEANNKEKDMENRKQGSFDLKQYIIIALMVFITFCCCILFFFMIYRYNGFAGFWKKLGLILQPITIGVVVAYLLNPIMKFLEHHCSRLIKKQIKNEKRAAKISRGLGIAGALLFLILLVVLLLWAIIPAVISSVQSVASNFSSEVNQLVDWVEDFIQGDSELAGVVGEAIEKASMAIEDFLNNDIMTMVQTYLTSITSGVYYGVKFVINVLVGLIVSIYVLAGKEKFAGQTKKIIYAVFKPVRGNIIIQTVRKSNEIFGGFISGKILDSAIIGVLAYIVLSIMKMPDTILVAVIIGVTNVIPFFGPFIGAVPSFIIIVLQNPMQGLYFLIFIVILQQVDGNIIGPKILGDSTGLSSFWVVFAIMVFGGLWGFPGMLLGVPVMAVIYYIAQQIVAYFLRKRGLSDATADYIDLVRVDKVTNKMIYPAKPSNEEEGEEQSS